uniref:Mobilization protein B n=1 Tax=Staphylococcus cohnii TaxID=29382 RepID=V5RL97_9STAP|nr:mobilization protein B [Staphylococcus cohnii]
MSLQDKLNENRSMSELFQETRELNELMKSYIRVHMNEEMAKEVTIHNQLNQIQSKSDEVMRNMQSILNEQEKMLKENTEVLQKILIDGHEEIQRNNNRTIQALGELQKTNNAQLEEMNEEIKSSVRNMQNNLNSVVKKARQETMDLVSSAKHGALVTNIIDALKYGVATSAITVPILYLLLS